MINIIVSLFPCFLCKLHLYLYAYLFQGPRSPNFLQSPCFIFSGALFIMKYELLMTLKLENLYFNIHSFDSFISLKRKGSLEVGGVIWSPALHWQPLRAVVREKWSVMLVLLTAQVLHGCRTIISWALAVTTHSNAFVKNAFVTSNS